MADSLTPPFRRVKQPDSSRSAARKDDVPLLDSRADIVAAHDGRHPWRHIWRLDESVRPAGQDPQRGPGWLRFASYCAADAADRRGRLDPEGHREPDAQRAVVRPSRV